MIKKKYLSINSRIFYKDLNPIIKTITFLSHQNLDAEARAIAAALAEKENPEKAEITEAAPEE